MTDAETRITKESNMTTPKGTDLPAIELPQSYGYVAVFLTLGCNLNCSFCINRFDNFRSSEKIITGRQWLQGLNRIISKPDLPITLQGGEPSLHEGFYEIINGLPSDLNIDILTNLQFDVEHFMANVPPERVRREAPYASIRVSYHPMVMELDDIKAKVLLLLENGYSVGIWAIEHPSQIKEIERAKQDCIAAGIDFRTKEFLGHHEGKLYGTYKYPQAVTGKIGPKVECKTTELIIGPSGSIYRCHSDFYNGREPVGNILDENFTIEENFRPCDVFGLCNPCDIKIKTNRFQQFGHTSVEIKFDSE